MIRIDRTITCELQSFYGSPLKCSDLELPKMKLLYSPREYIFTFGHNSHIDHKSQCNSPIGHNSLIGRGGTGLRFWARAGSTFAFSGSGRVGPRPVCGVKARAGSGFRYSSSGRVRPGPNNEVSALSFE